MIDKAKGEFFSDEISDQIREQFSYIDADIHGNKRLFFENAGGSLRLKKAVESFSKLELIGDCPGRNHKIALELKEVIAKGQEDIRRIFGTPETGSLLTFFTASQVMFEMTRVIGENLPGTNIVTTLFEHPSAYDSAFKVAKNKNIELRVARPNVETGFVDADEIASLIDENTVFLSVIYASNVFGTILDMTNIVKKAREKKPDLFIISDAVQHAPHGFIEAEKLGLDAVNFAPYKFFGTRGFSVGWVSDRVSKLNRFTRIIEKADNDWSVGSTSPAQYASISEVVSYVAWLGAFYSYSEDRTELFEEGMKRIKLHERALLNYLLEGSSNIRGLRHMKGVKLHLDYPDLTLRDLILAMSIEGIDLKYAVKEYEKRNVIVFQRSADSLFSKRIVESVGLEGVIRVSPMHFHTKKDIDQFLQITQDIINSIE